MIGALLIAALAGAAPFRAAQIEVPGAIEQLAIPGTMPALGVPVRLRAVRSSLKVEELIAHFEQVFEDAGLFVPAEGELRSAGNLVQVTGFDVINRSSVSALLQVNRDGTTTVVLGEANLQAAKKQGPPAFAPVFPGAVGLIVANLEIGQSLSFSAKAKVEELEGFYRETLTGAGYREAEKGQYAREGALIRVWLKPREAGAVGVVIVRTTR